jgi:hypothetical protein
MRKSLAALLLLGAMSFGNAALAADNTEWENPEAVTIYGYSGPSQDAFIAPASPIMLFDSHTDDATIPSNIFQAYRFDYRTFLNLGMVQGLDYGIKGNPNIDATGNFVWWTNAFYPQILATAIQGKFVNGVVSAVAPVMGISRGWVYWVTMSPEISADGNTLLYGDFNTDSEGVPLRSVLTIATKNGDGSFSKTPGSDGMLAAVNAAVPIVYNGRMSSDGLELYFTGVVYVPSGPQVYVAKRASVTAPFDAPQLIAVAGQKAENGSLSRDGKHLYHHKMLGPLNAQSQIYVMSRP